MKGNQKIIDSLNGLLAMELAAMDQYFIHSQMYLDWGLHKLYARISHEFEDEKGHATVLIERMLFLEGIPDMVTRDGFKVGTDVKSMLESDLRVEYEVADRLKAAIALCEKEQDFVTRSALIPLLEDTEMDHAHWLEQQLGLIERIGMENYMQSQIGEGEPEG
ncbi:MAG: bacterioferritin [Pseudohongiellaceae bacterium]